MNDLIEKFDNIFNCPKCKKTLWRYKKLPDGRSVCISCYDIYMKKKNENIKRKLAYIELASRDLINNGLSGIIMNFFEKKYNKNPIESEVVKLWKLLYLNYKQDIDYEIFFDVINKVYDIVKEKNDLESFEKDLNPEKKSIKNRSYNCMVCKSKIDKKTYNYSNKYFNKALCKKHQGTKHHKDLFLALKKRGIPCEFEAYDGNKHIDIAIHDIKLYIEVDGKQPSIDSKQFIADLKRGTFSDEEGYQTRRFTNKMIDEHLEEIAENLKEAYEKIK
jgi:very-short-patch-repair endonuclease